MNQNDLIHDLYMRRLQSGDASATMYGQSYGRSVSGGAYSGGKYCTGDGNMANMVYSPLYAQSPPFHTTQSYEPSGMLGGKCKNGFMKQCLPKQPKKKAVKKPKKTVKKPKTVNKGNKNALKTPYAKGVLKQYRDFVNSAKAQYPNMSMYDINCNWHMSRGKKPKSKKIKKHCDALAATPNKIEEVYKKLIDVGLVKGNGLIGGAEKGALAALLSGLDAEIKVR